MSELSLLHINRCIRKDDLAEKLRMKPWQLRKLLNKKYKEDLKLLGYDPNQKILLPHQANWLFRKLDITIDEKSN